MIFMSTLIMQWTNIKTYNTYSFITKLFNPTVKEGGLPNHGGHVPRDVVLEVWKRPHAVLTVVGGT